MTKPGRKSSAELALTAELIQQYPKPKPPANLTPQERAHFLVVIDRLPNDYYMPEQLPLLVQYARHCANADYLSDAIGNEKRKKPPNFANICKLMDQLGRETARIVSLATKMRLTQQSRIDRKKERAPIDEGNPWD